MDAVYSWIKNIIFFLLLTAVLDQLLAGSENKKYIRIFTGFMLILIVIAPVVKWLNAGVNFDYYLDSNAFAMDAYDYSDEITGADQKRDDAVIAEYRQAIAEQAGSLLEKKGYRAVSVAVTVDTDAQSGGYGRIQTMDVTAQRAVEETDASSNPQAIEKIAIGKVILGEEKEEERISPEELSLREYLSDYYVLPEENITVRIKEGGYGEKEAVN